MLQQPMFNIRLLGGAWLSLKDEREVCRILIEQWGMAWPVLQETWGGSH